MFPYTQRAEQQEDLQGIPLFSVFSDFLVSRGEGVVESSEKAASLGGNLALALRSKEGSELVSCQLSRLSGATLDAFCWELVTAILPAAWLTEGLRRPKKEMRSFS